MPLVFTLKIIFRSWWRNKLFFLIAVTSLSIGLAGTNLLMTYFVHDYFIEEGNPYKDRIFCLRQDNPFEQDQKVAYAAGDAPMKIKETIPGVEDYFRIQSFGNASVEYDGHTSDNLNIIGVDSTLNGFFPTTVVSGDLSQALVKPDKVAMSRSYSKRIFGNDNPLGKSLKIHFDEGMKIVEVVAIVEDNTQSLLKFDMLSKLSDDYYGGVTFIRLSNGVSPSKIESAIRADESIKTLLPGQTQYYVDKLSDLYFVSAKGTSQQPLPFIQQAQVQLLYAGILSALLILVIACCNYTNMNISRMMQQLKMIHVEKLMGGSMREIRTQLFGDVLLTVIISFLFSMIIIADVLPYFNSVLGSRLTFSFFFSGMMFPILVVFMLVIAVIPAWYASRRLMKMDYSEYRTTYTGRNRQLFVGALVVVQFAIACALVLATDMAYKQKELIVSRACHYEGLIEIGDMFAPPAAPMKAALEKDVEGIKSVSLSKSSILYSFIRELDIPQYDGSEKHSFLLMIYSDTSLVRTMGLRQLSGYSPDKLHQQFSYPALVNESYVRNLVPEGVDPIGRTLREFDELADSLYVVGGVINDFPVNSLENEITPAVIYLPPASEMAKANVLHIKMDIQNKEETISRIKAKWEEVNEGVDFKYIDMYSDFMDKNKRFTSYSEIITIYAVIGLLLTLFGLMGISWYAIRQRSREIRIRKIHGANNRDILWLLNKPFIILATIAYLIALPVTYGLVSSWLEQFAYHVSFSLFDFILPLFAVWIVAVVTVGVNSSCLKRSQEVK